MPGSRGLRMIKDIIIHSWKALAAREPFKAGEVSSSADADDERPLSWACLKNLGDQGAYLLWRYQALNEQLRQDQRACLQNVNSLKAWVFQASVELCNNCLYRPFLSHIPCDSHDHALQATSRFLTDSHGYPPIGTQRLTLLHDGRPDS